MEITASSDRSNFNTFILTFFSFPSSCVEKNKTSLVLFFMCILLACKTLPKEESLSTNNDSNKDLSDKETVQFKVLFFNANKERILGNYDLAETLFYQALKLDPNSAASMYELANIYTFQNNKRQALYYSRKAASIDPQNVWYQLQFANCLKDNKQFGSVIAVYERLVKNNPENFDFYYELANAYLVVGKLGDAIKVYDKIESKIGVTEEASMQKLKIYKMTKNTDKAVQEAKALIKTFPKEGKYYGMLGELYQDKGLNDKAMQAYNDLLAIDPTNAYVHLALADFYRSQKQDEKAFEEIKIAFQSTDLDIDTKVKILLSYYAITETYTELKSDADELCKIIITVHPDEAKAFSIYGDFLFRDKKFEDARTQYRKAIALDKEKYALWNQLLIIESELNDFAAMQKESEEAIELFPTQALPYFFSGASNIQLKHYQEAIDELSEGKEFVFENKLLLAQFYSSIGDAQYQLKNYAESDAAYDKSLELDSANAYVLNNYSYYLSLRDKELEKAEQMSKKSNDLDPNNSSYQDTYGWVLYQMKKYDDAKIWIEKALESGGKNSGTILEHYGDILYQLGDIENAIVYWIDAKKHNVVSNFIDKKIADRKIYE